MKKLPPGLIPFLIVDLAICLSIVVLILNKR